MADPLSATASVLTLLTGATKLIGLIKMFGSVPDDILALGNEIADLQVVFNEVTHSHNTARDLAPQVLALVNEVRFSLEEVEKFLRRYSGSRARRLLAVRDIRKNRDAIRSVKQKLAGISVLRIIKGMQRIEVELGKINSESASVKGSQLGPTPEGNPTTQSPREAPTPVNTYETMFTRVDNSTPVLQSAAGTSGRLPAGDDVLCIQTSHRAKYSCPCLCNCICHHQGNFQTSGFFRQLCGSMFVGYTGLPFITPACDNQFCCRRSVPAIQITYYFPFWYFARIRWFVALDMGIPSLPFYLKIVRTVPSDADIFHAAGCGDTESIIQMFRQKKASPMDVAAADGRSPLHTAVNMGRFNVCELLLREGADPKLIDNDSISPISMAREKYLCFPSSRATINLLFQDNICFADFEFTSLHQIVVGLKQGDIQEELQRVPSSINHTDAYGNTALLWAMKTGNLRAVNILLDHQANPNICDKAKRSPLHYAGRCQDPRIITKLIRCQADIRKKTRWGSSALHFAVVQGSDNVAFPKLLLDLGLQLDDQNYYHRTALAEAAKYDRQKVARFLMEEGADINSENAERETPLMEAIIHDSHRCLSLFLSSNARYTGRTKRRNTILHLVALSGGLAVLQLLAKAKLNGINVHTQNVDGLTATEIAHGRLCRPVGFLEAFAALEASIQNADIACSESGSSGDKADVISEEIFVDATEYL
ncbi:MAG: hypothetical protein M1839_001393 [Geoglossum umbratile]|nr:MAG: hypothetical protein M1839_001393 [Geoglossum umbratile]